MSGAFPARRRRRDRSHEAPRLLASTGGPHGHPGDTLASALLANGVRLFGRIVQISPAARVLSAGPEEPNALVDAARGRAAGANARRRWSNCMTG